MEATWQLELMELSTEGASLFVMIAVGLNQGMQPIAGYNFGAKQIDRVNKVLKLTIMLATAIMTVGFIVVNSSLMP